MILTVTINPLLEKRLTYKKIKLGNTHRNPELELAAGGKGLNVSRQLNHFNTASTAFTFLGGENGKLLRKLLEQEKIEYNFVRTEANTREGYVVIDGRDNLATTFMASNESITKAEVADFTSRLERMIQNCEMVVFSGSSPCKEADSIFPMGIEMANKYDKVSFLDTYGSHYQDCLNAGPTVIHNNLSEIESSLGIKLETDDQIRDYMTKLYDSKVKQTYLTDGEEDFFVANFDFHYIVRVPKTKLVDSTGCGDAFMASVVYGWYKDNIFNDVLKLAVATGSLNAGTLDVCKVKYEDAQTLADTVLITPVGKKMKIIDDSPTIK